MATSKAARNAGRPDEAIGDPWEESLQRLADTAALHRDVAISSATAHVHAVAEIARAQATERGGDVGAEVASLIEAIRTDLNTALDRLAGLGGGA